MSWPFSKRESAEGTGDWTGFLAQGVRLEGTLELPGTFRLDAMLKGNIVSNHSLILGEGAHVEGQIEGNHIAISGHFDGVIFAKGRVEIQSKGVVTGEIHTPCLVIEAGGIFDGQCHMLAASEASGPITISIRSVRGRAAEKSS